jgi:hypothetical protein
LFWGLARTHVRQKINGEKAKEYAQLHKERRVDFSCGDFAYHVKYSFRHGGHGKTGKC